MWSAARERRCVVAARQRGSRRAALHRAASGPRARCRCLDTARGRAGRAGEAARSFSAGRNERRSSHQRQVRGATVAYTAWTAPDYVARSKGGAEHPGRYSSSSRTPTSAQLHVRLDQPGMPNTAPPERRPARVYERASGAAGPSRVSGHRRTSPVVTGRRASAVGTPERLEGAASAAPALRRGSGQAARKRGPPGVARNRRSNCRAKPPDSLPAGQETRHGGHPRHVAGHRRARHRAADAGHRDAGAARLRGAGRTRAREGRGRRHERQPGGPLRAPAGRSRTDVHQARPGAVDPSRPAAGGLHRRPRVAAGQRPRGALRRHPRGDRSRARPAPRRRLRLGRGTPARHGVDRPDDVPSPPTARRWW